MSQDHAKHPSDAVLLGHVAGTLSIAHHLVVATHASGCGECQATINFLERIGAEILAQQPAAQPPAGVLERCLVSITAGREPARTGTPRQPPFTLDGITLPRELAGLRPTRLRTLAPGIRHSILWRDDRGTLHLLKVRAGVAMPSHRHRGLELTCVLSGAFRDNDGHYDVGEVAEQEADEDHEIDHVVIAEPPSDCVCIMATTNRLRFVGWMARLLQPVMPF